MSDRRRINGPAGATAPPVFLDSPTAIPSRTRKAKELRRIFLQTGLIPSASGSSYFECEVPKQPRLLLGQTSTIKLSCAVHGPKPLPRNAAFSPNLQLTASIKFAPFAIRVRRGYVRDSTERDLGVHLENALKAMIIPDRWPKSAVEIAITVLEAEDDHTSESQDVKNVGLMNILSGSITAASAALVDAKMDVLDLMSGGVAAVSTGQGKSLSILLDPAPAEHASLVAAGVVGYLPSRDEVTEIWTTGSLSDKGQDNDVGLDDLLDKAILAAKAVQPLLKESVLESARRSIAILDQKGKARAVASDQDIEMKT